MTDIQNLLVEYATKHGKAIEEGDHKTANKFHTKLMSIYHEIKKGESWHELKGIFSTLMKSVKLWVATFLTRMR